MSQKNWKLLFQEKALFLKLMAIDAGKLTRQEALGLVQGEGRRLDELVREGWILILDEEIFPGAGLMLVQQFGEASLLELMPIWEMSCDQLLRTIAVMENAESLPLREQAGALVFDRMLLTRSWAFLLHAAILQESLSEAEVVAVEFESLATSLRSVILRSSGFPEWEMVHWQLIDFLEERASYLRLSDQGNASERLQKLKTISRLRREELPLATNLESIVASGDFLLLHKKLGIVSWPFFPSQEKIQPSAQHVANVQFEAHELSTENFIPEWRASGTDLLSFLDEKATERNLTQEEKLHTFSRILAESGEGIMWKKDSSGKKWEVWPVN